ncbi:hypothetical protein [Streptomyces sp. NPDC004728]
MAICELAAAAQPCSVRHEWALLREPQGMVKKIIRGGGLLC